MHIFIPGEWYLLFTCESCKTSQILFPDLSKGKASLRAVYSVTCAKCGHTGSYDGDVLERYEHPLVPAASGVNPLASDSNARIGETGGSGAETADRPDKIIRN